MAPTSARKLCSSAPSEKLSNRLPFSLKPRLYSLYYPVYHGASCTMAPLRLNYCSKELLVRNELLSDHAADSDHCEACVHACRESREGPSTARVLQACTAAGRKQRSHLQCGKVAHIGSVIKAAHASGTCEQPKCGFDSCRSLLRPLLSSMVCISFMDAVTFKIVLSPSGIYRFGLMPSGSKSRSPIARSKSRMLQNSVAGLCKHACAQRLHGQRACEELRCGCAKLSGSCTS
jgi:hypothetical protein